MIVANPRPTKLDRYATQKVRYTYGDEIAAVQGIDLSEAENAIVFYGSEGLGSQGSAALAHACADLLVKTGHTNKANNGLVAVWQKANEQGAWDLGLRPIADLKTAIQAAKVVYFVAADPAGDDETIKALLETRYERPEALTIVQDIFLTETSLWADIVLPAQAQTEREGTFTSGERRVQRQCLGIFIGCVRCSPARSLQPGASFGSPPRSALRGATYSGRLRSNLGRYDATWTEPGRRRTHGAGPFIRIRST